MFPLTQAALTTPFVVVNYIVFRMVYRLYFHRLARFLGPELTAATCLAEHYYELFHGAVPQMARQEHGLWKERRRVLDPFFSSKKISGYVPGMQVKTNRLLRRLKEEYSEKGKVLNVTTMWECFAADNVVSFCFKKNYDFLNSPGFVSGVNEAVTNMVGLTHWMDFDAVAAQENQIEGVLRNYAKGEKIGDTLCASLLDNGLADREQHLVFDRLQSDAKADVVAGSETTARSLPSATLHLLDQPEAHKWLREELKSANPDESVMLEWHQLSQLPYLSACIEQTFPLSYDLSERRQRVYDRGALLYHDGKQDWAIPPGTSGSMDRWLGTSKAPDGKLLNRCMVTFGKGDRSCVGMQLAYAQLYVGLANFLRSGMSERAELYESSKADLEMAMCRFVPRPRLGSEGVRVLLHAGR
ncbi:hypothetical protein DOTSEDRAFT_67106 [Dothistroma septosporum NZE10]|uniref:Uncharacterized protein n=1 Tax=Dothistroma septosporum (strain NZE10 / CBS 128990) TaxID=675120 RepID=N1PDN0_DOTSN|nr:hypothetical protein DOTSEDRAFT_67106 [Dothistroma septosporum NZE10]